MKRIFQNDWHPILQPVMEGEHYQELRQRLYIEYKTHTIYPPADKIFNALHTTAFSEVKVVIIGKDPYHQPGQANGLCFSVNPDVPIPKSLVNIYKELHNDLGYEIPDHGDLTYWAEQGVLLLNSSLTVRRSQAASHRPLGWEKFTDEIIKALNKREEGIVFILWGNHAKSKAELITNPKHKIISSVHPSPLSAHRGFFGSKPFSRANEYLKEMEQEPIDWDINNAGK